MSNKLSVAFRLYGNINDYIPELNFVQHFFERFRGYVRIAVYGSEKEEINDGLMKDQDFISTYDEQQNYRKELYDLSVSLHWFPKIEHVNMEHIQSFPELRSVVEKWSEFSNSQYTKEYISGNSVFEPNIYTYATVNEENRLTVMDIGDCLGIKRLTLSLQISNHSSDVLKKYGLMKNKFITIHIQKEWQKKNYEMLCEMIRSKFSDILLVQLGEGREIYSIPSVDVCLVNQIDFEELKVLLKYAFLHIDGDSGMVHIRKSLRANPSIALFGTTPAHIFGYEDDIIIAPFDCPGTCRNLFSAWKRGCLRSKSSSLLCMEAITPKIVYNAAKQFIETRTVPKKNANRRSLKNNELIENKDFSLDEKWARTWLLNHKVYAWLVKRTALKNLFCSKLTKNGYVRVPISEMPMYHYMTGNKDSYYKYVNLNDTYAPGHEHSVTRLEEVKKQLDFEGFKKSKIIVVDGKNLILDGVYRACWLLAKNGLEYEIPVVKVYGNWELD